MVDSDLNIIFEPMYDNISVNAPEGSAYLTLNGVKQLVTFEGEVLQPFVIDEAWPMRYMVKYNVDEADEYELHPYLIKVMVDYRNYGVMDSRTGKIIIPTIYTDVKMISKDLIMAELYGNEENNVVFNTSGKMME